jgi:histone H3/H4
MSETKNVAIIPASKVKKIMLEAGESRVSKETAQYMADHLKEYLVILTKKSNANCVFAKRKTIAVADVEKALNE